MPQEEMLLYMNMYASFWQYLAEFLLDWEVFRTEVVEKIKAHISCSITFFFFYENRAV